MFDLIGSCIKLENGQLECYICGAKQSTNLSQTEDIKISKEDAEFCNRHAKLCFEDYHKLSTRIQQRVTIEVDHRTDESKDLYKRSKDLYKRTYYYLDQQGITTGDTFQNVSVGLSIPRFIALKWAKGWREQALGPSWLQDEDLMNGLESLEGKKVKSHKTGLEGEITFTEEVYRRRGRDDDGDEEQHIEITWSDKHAGNKITITGKLQDEKFKDIEILDPDDKTVHYEYRIKIETTTVEKQPPFFDSLKDK